MSKFFADIATISLQSGNGGDGAVSFRREKFVPRGGPDGGDGGDGGDVVLQASGDERTLRNLRMNKTLSAESGKNGSGSNRHGKNGEDLLLLVPVGSVIKDSYGVQIAQLSAEGERFVILRGGRGGRGNAFFKSSVRQAPQFSQKGEAGVGLLITVELELIADFGFVGAPNAGKSTLLKTLTKANPKIGNYPFTTLVPNLGTLRNFEKEIILADIPGLIEGASQGIGLGFEFLKHIKKTTGLVFVLDAYIEDLHDIEDTEDSDEAVHDQTRVDTRMREATVRHICAQYAMLLHEMNSYDPSLLHKTQILVLSKIDASPFTEDAETLAVLSDMIRKDIVSIQEKLGMGSGTIHDLISISSFTGRGIEVLKTTLFAVNC